MLYCAGQSVSKPDSVVGSSVFMKQGSVIFRTTEEKLEKKKKNKQT